MSGRTSHYGWAKHQQGDSFADGGYKYTFIDREAMDQIAWLGAEGHHHIGGTIAAASPSGPPTLELSLTGGRIPANSRVYYKISLVNSANQESVASAESYIDTPAAISEPGAPTPTYITTGGELFGGNYYYVLSAYVSLTTNETKALSSVFLTVNSTTGTNKITLQLPSLPAGADGFNIYRRAPGESRYFYLDSVDMNVATPPSTYVDDGSTQESYDRTVPVTNTTNASNSITVTYPGATVPTGYTWRIYRTYINTTYARSLLTSVVEFTAEATPTITPTYIDIGLATGSGEPQTSVSTLTNPEQIDLTDAAEIQGHAPIGSLSGIPFTVRFDLGTQTGATTGRTAWVCEFPAATIIGCRAFVGAGQTANGDVVGDVKKGASSATPTFTSIYVTTANRPKVASAQQRSSRTVPDTRTLVVGDALTADIISISGGTPSAPNFSVEVYLVGHGFSTTTSYVAGSSTGAT